MNILLRRAAMPTTLMALLATAPSYAVDPSSVYSAFGASVFSGVSPYIVVGLIEGPNRISRITRDATGTQLTLQGPGDAAEIVVRIPPQVARRANLKVGAQVDVSAVPAGHLLHADGKVVAFAPNETGRGLAHSRRVTHSR